MKCWLFACILSAAVAASAAAQGTVPRSVWNGVYTEEQARRGEQLSTEHCARCHGQALEGAEAAPALVGYAFNGNWEGVPLSDLFDRVRVSMPLDAPGSLSRQQNVDVVAYLLKVGQFPAGDGELVAQGGALAQITFVSYRPQP
jgi:mono/diheme cytochrome c family protein